MKKAATYVRLSASRLGEEAPGLERQRTAVERLIRERTWELEDRHRFVEADVSAFRPGTPRPRFAALREAVDSGEIGAVVVWKLDRLFRRLKEGADFLDLCRERGVALVSTEEGVDTSSSYGGILFAIFASLGEIESQGRSDRISAWHRQRAEKGLPSGGGTRGFGFAVDGIKHVPAEAREIRKAVQKLLAGATLAGVTRDWNERGVRTPPFKRNGKQHPGGPWAKSSVRRLLTSPRIAGLRRHGDETHAAKWKPIISEKEHLRLLSIFGDNRPPGNAGRRYLLTGGLAVCGLCGSALIARPKGDGRRAYCCAADHGGCGKIRTLAAPIEELVARDANRAWEERYVESGPEPEDDPTPQLAADEAALEELARDRYVTRSISDAEFQAAREPLVARIAELQERIGRSAQRRTHLWKPADETPAPWELPPGTDPDPDDFEGWRSWIAEVVERVVVGPAVKGRNFFDPSRIEVVPR